MASELASLADVANVVAAAEPATTSSSTSGSKSTSSSSKVDDMIPYYKRQFLRFARGPAILPAERRNVRYLNDHYTHNFIKDLVESDITSEVDRKALFIFANTLGAKKILWQGGDGCLAKIGDHSLFVNFEEIFPIPHTDMFSESVFRKLASFLTSSTLFSKDYRDCFQSFASRNMEGSAPPPPLFAQNSQERKRFLNHLAAGYCETYSAGEGMYCFENVRSAAFRLCLDLIGHFNLPMACSSTDSQGPGHLKKCCLLHTGRCECGICKPWTREEGLWVSFAKRMKRHYRNLFYKGKGSQFGTGFKKVYFSTYHDYVTRGEVRFVPPTVRDRVAGNPGQRRK